MKPVPHAVLLALLLTLCALCAWQWHREGALRGIAARQAAGLATLTAGAQEADARIHASTAEILRLTGSLTELRAGSLPAVELQEIQQANAKLSEASDQQNAAIQERNEALVKADTAIRQANLTIQKLTLERDGLAKRLNETAAKYNKLVGTPNP